MTTLLLVEDDDALRTFLADNLTADGFKLTVAPGVREGLRQLEERAPDLAIVDVCLPDGSGLELIRRVRMRGTRADPEQRFLVLSGRAGEEDRVRGLERGADDYLVKPFSYKELLLRSRALLRRGHATSARVARMQIGPLEIDPVSHEVRVRGERVDVSAKEFALLRVLASEPCRVFTKEELLRDVWGFIARGTTRTLDSHACRLRRKLGAHGDHFIVNVWGVGYRLVDGELEPGA